MFEIILQKTKTKELRDSFKKRYIIFPVSSPIYYGLWVICVKNRYEKGIRLKIIIVSSKNTGTIIPRKESKKRELD